jgi:hypothetical protein
LGIGPQPPTVQHTWSNPGAAEPPDPEPPPPEAGNNRCAVCQRTRHAAWCVNAPHPGDEL